MADTVNTIRNTIIEHSVATEAAVTDSIYETSEVLLMNIDSLRKEVRQTNASVERLEATINNLFNNIRIENARENAAMIRELEIKSDLNHLLNGVGIDPVAEMQHSFNNVAEMSHQ